MQKILYGSSLEEHLKFDVIGQKLMQQLPKQPDIIFVETVDLLGIRRIARSPAAFLSKRDGRESGGSLSVLKYESEEDDKQKVGEILVSLESAVDLIEPFTRIRDALKEAMKASRT